MCICGVGLLFLLTAGSPALSGHNTVHFEGFLRSLQDNEPGNRDFSVYPQTCNAPRKICCPSPYPLCFWAQYISEHLGTWSDVLLHGWPHQLSTSSGELFHLLLVKYIALKVTGLGPFVSLTELYLKARQPSSQLTK